MKKGTYEEKRLTLFEMIELLEKDSIGFDGAEIADEAYKSFMKNHSLQSKD